MYTKAKTKLKHLSTPPPPGDQIDHLIVTEGIFSNEQFQLVQGGESQTEWIWVLCCEYRFFTYHFFPLPLSIHPSHRWTAECLISNYPWIIQTVNEWVNWEFTALLIIQWDEDEQGYMLIIAIKVVVVSTFYCILTFILPFTCLRLKNEVWFHCLSNATSILLRF